MKPIVQGATNKILRTRSEEVSDPQSPEIQNLITEMRETLAATPNGIGLAAPQIGVNKRIFIIDPDVAKEYEIRDTFINPIITKIAPRELDLEEGCLSIPELFGMVKRAKHLNIEALDDTGAAVKIKAERLLAHIIQHETDHLNGVLFIDHATELYQVEAEPATSKKES